MKVRLLNYHDDEFFVEIPDDTEEITIEIISGDMIMISPVYFDTDVNNTRMLQFNDGMFTLTKDQFHLLNEIEDSYELLESL